MTQPRPVGLSTRLRIFFGSPLAWIGLPFFILGCVFLLVFGQATDFASPFVFKRSDPHVPGVLIAKTGTNSRVNKQRIYDYHYRYQVEHANYEGHAFDTDNGVQPGNAVLVQVAAGDPATSRLEGMRLAPFGMAAVALCAIFPAIGIGMLYFAARRYRKYLHLVRHGVLTTGKVLRKEATSTKVNEQTVYRVIFQFKTQSGSLHESSVSTHLTDMLGDEAREPLVYDAARPSDAVLLDALPRNIRTMLTGS